MKIAIIGATGHAGSFILDEALSRDLDVTAIVRHPEKLPSDVPFIQKDLFELTTTDLTSFDVVVDAFNAPKGKEEMHQTSLSHLIEILEGTDTRSLFLDTEKTTRMIDQVPKNAPFYPTAFNMYEGLLKLKQSKNLQWTYISPASLFDPHGKRTGTYLLSDDYLQRNAAGDSTISMADYAIASVDEILDKQHEKQHISVVSR